VATTNASNSNLIVHGTFFRDIGGFCNAASDDYEIVITHRDILVRSTRFIVSSILFKNILTASST
jgi:hypothetical protein